MINKLAVLFPGIGYHCDKPLLYYSRNLVREMDYEIREIHYGSLPSGVKGDGAKMRQAFIQALEDVTEQLSNVPWSSYNDIVFISKSLGTAVAAAYAKQNAIPARQIYYTPVEASFEAIGTMGIVFHGTGDSWADTKVICQKCKDRGIKLYLTEGANHSMETGDTIKDLENIRNIMTQTKKYLLEM